MVTNLCYGAYAVSGAVLRAYCYCLVASLMSDYATLWTVVHQAPLSMGFSRQEYWSGLPCPPAGDLPNPGIKPVSAALKGRLFATEPPGKPLICV